MKKIVLIGDSIRMRYQPLVIEKLKGKAEVWGPVENCQHSLWALAHFQEWVADQKPDILHFNFGIHDAKIAPDGQCQIILDQYRLCLNRFIKAGKDLSAKLILIWATCTPRYAMQKDQPMSSWPKMTEIDKYNAAALKIVKAHDLAINDLHRVVLDNNYAKCLDAGGCHPTEFGKEVLAQAVVRAVSEFL